MRGELVRASLLKPSTRHAQVRLSFEFRASFSKTLNGHGASRGELANPCLVAYTACVPACLRLSTVSSS